MHTYTDIMADVSCEGHSTATLVMCVLSLYEIITAELKRKGTYQKQSLGKCFGILLSLTCVSVHDVLLDALSSPGLPDILFPARMHPQMPASMHTWFSAHIYYSYGVADSCKHSCHLQG